jgi:hypothetical protein
MLASYRSSAILIAGYCGMLVVAVKAADFAHGREQVEKFIHDRPDTGVVINLRPAVKEQIAVLFADDGQGDSGKVNRVYWSNAEPVTSDAENSPSDDDHPTYVRVTKRPEHSAIDKCSSLVFELHNVRNGRNFKALTSRIVRGGIAREDYVEDMVRLEFEALMKTKEFFHRNPLGDVKSKDEGYAWIMRLTGNYRDYLREINLESKKAYCEVYRAYYDKILLCQPPSAYPLSRRALIESWTLPKSLAGEN